MTQPITIPVSFYAKGSRSSFFSYFISNSDRIELFVVWTCDIMSEHVADDFRKLSMFDLFRLSFANSNVLECVNCVFQFEVRAPILIPTMALDTFR